MENRKRRATQLESMLSDAQARLAEHASSLRVLDAEEKTSLERKVELYTRKLEMLQQVPDDTEIDRILQRERERDVRVHARRERERERQQYASSTTTREEGEL